MRETAGPLSLVVLQSTGFCNIDCSYCYLPDRANPNQTMSLETVAEVARLIFDRAWLRRDLDIVWHAGEPLTLTPSYYADAIAILERRRPRDLRVHYGIQTNATLITGSWIDLFERHDFSIGISFDGPADLHDLYRTYRSGRGSHDRAAAGLAKLRARNYPFHFIGVVTRASLPHGRRLIDYYRRFRPTGIGLNIEEQEAAHGTSSLGGDDRDAFEDFITDAAMEAAKPGAPVALRDLQRAMSSLISGKPEDNDQVIPLRMLNVAFNGDISTFSPELLALAEPARARFIFGNVHHCARLADILRDERFVAAYAEISRGVANCAGSCDYFQFCGGGAPVNKFSETGSLEATDTVFCSLTKKAWIDVCLRLANAPGSRFELSA